MTTISYTIVEVKDADDSYGLFENLDLALEFVAETIDTDVDNIELTPSALNDDLFRVTVDGISKSLWLEYRDVMC